MKKDLYGCMFVGNKSSVNNLKNVIEGGLPSSVKIVGPNKIVGPEPTPEISAGPGPTLPEITFDLEGTDFQWVLGPKPTAPEESSIDCPHCGKAITLSVTATKKK